jgi:hypothetical protein
VFSLPRVVHKFVLGMLYTEKLANGDQCKVRDTVTETFCFSAWPVHFLHEVSPEICHKGQSCSCQLRSVIFSRSTGLLNFNFSYYRIKWTVDIY